MEESVDSLNATQVYEDDHESESDAEYEQDFEASQGVSPPSDGHKSSKEAFSPPPDLGAFGGRLAHTMPLTIHDLKDIIAELPEGFQQARGVTSPTAQDHRSSTPAGQGGRYTPVNKEDDEERRMAAGFLSSFEPEPKASIIVNAAGLSAPPPAWGDDRERAVSPYPRSDTSSPPRQQHSDATAAAPPAPPAVDIDTNLLLRLLLHTALLDIPPKESISAPVQPPANYYPSYCDPLATIRLPKPSLFYTHHDVQQQYHHQQHPPVVAGGSGLAETTWRPLPNRVHHPSSSTVDVAIDNIDDGAFHDSASYQRARILERASQHDITRAAQQDKKGNATCRRRRSALDANVHERHLFEEAYARFASRLSHLSRQELATDQAEPLTAAMGQQALQKKMSTLRMARAVGESVREVFTDPVVIELIKEATMCRYRSEQDAAAAEVPE